MIGYVFLGGGVGALLRYIFDSNIMENYKGKLPVGTLIVNLLSSFLIGYVYSHFESGDSRAITFITVGFLGGLSTFSSYILQSYNFIKKREINIFITYIILSNVFGVILGYLGYELGVR